MRLNAPRIAGGRETEAGPESDQKVEFASLPESMERTLRDGDFEISAG